ncbi:MAG: hypothetical protein AAGC79_05525 [Pseudomonadota bacterium]
MTEASGITPTTTVTFEVKWTDPRIEIRDRFYNYRVEEAAEFSFSDATAVAGTLLLATIAAAYLLQGYDITPDRSHIPFILGVFLGTAVTFAAAAFVLTRSLRALLNHENEARRNTRAAASAHIVIDNSGIEVSAPDERLRMGWSVVDSVEMHPGFAVLRFNSTSGVFLFEECMTSDHSFEQAINLCRKWKGPW